MVWLLNIILMYVCCLLLLIARKLICFKDNLQLRKNVLDTGILFFFPGLKTPGVSSSNIWNLKFPMTVAKSSKLVTVIMMRIMLLLLTNRAARIVAALQPGCEEMEREWGNEEEMEIEWGNKEEMEREWGNGEEMERDLLSTFPHSLFISSPSIHFLYQNLSHFVPKCQIRLFCRECHKKLNIRAMRK